MPFFFSHQPLFLKHIAIILVALCAYSIRAQGLNSLENGSASISPNSASPEQAERQRIAQERLKLNASFELQRAACYQQFAVNACLTQVRDQHNEKMRDLQRQEVSLNDAKRKQSAADRLRVIDERHSPQAQLSQAQKRGRALEASARREQARKEAQSRQTATQPANALKQTQDVDSGKRAPSANAQARSERKTAKPASDTAQLEGRRQQVSLREQAAQERRAKLQAREANRKKPLSAPLPTPRSAP